MAMRASKPLAMLASLAILSTVLPAGAALGAAATKAKSEAAAESHAAGVGVNGLTAQATRAGPPAPRRIETLVVVYGFRVQSLAHRLRLQALRQGYAAVVKREECRVQICAFVAVRRGESWHVTNVRSGEEQTLIEMSHELTTPESTFVMVHPPGDRLMPPYID